MRQKLSFQFIRDLWPAYEPFGHRPEKATKKGYQHKHNPSAKPSKSKNGITPAEWHRLNRHGRKEYRSTVSNQERSTL